MYHPEHFCQHLNQIIDSREGHYVCCDCGLVLSALYIDNYSYPINKSNDWIEEIKDYLDRIHIPQYFTTLIYNYFDKTYNQKNMKNMICSIYKVLNENGIPISLNEISETCAVSCQSIVKAQKDNVKLIKEELAEKYCQFLNLSYKTITVIKEQIKNSYLSGHSPNTIVAAIIYKIAKKERQRISMKEISKLMNVSCISIQRYLNYLQKCTSTKV
jgi:transcription initiation factor TFIIIB Brf1 subunit/transcription initiation factor TFIIB